MLRTAIRNLLAHKARLAMSGLAVVLGVAFVAGTLTFTDALNKTFTDLFKDAAADVSVEPKAAFDTGMAGMDMNSASSSLPASLVDKVAAVDGVLTDLDADPARVRRLAHWDWIEQAFDCLPASSSPIAA